MDEAGKAPFALAVYMISLAFFARFMPDATRQSHPWRWFTAAVVVVILGEVVWLSSAATLRPGPARPPLPAYLRLMPLFLGRPPR